MSWDSLSERLDQALADAEAEIARLRDAIARVEALRDRYLASLAPGDAGEVLAYVCGDLDRALRGESA